MNLSRDIRNMTEIEVACSLPICNREKELCFCYSVQNVSENEFQIARIVHIYERTHGSDKISEIDLLKYFSAEQMKEIRAAVNRFSVEDELLADLYEEYMERYEMFYEYRFQEALNEKQRANNRRMLELLNGMLKGTMLLKIYHYLGKEMILYLRENRNVM